MKKNFKVLIVDDENDILEFLEYSFKQEGYKVFTAKNGLKAIKKASDIIPDLILLDVMMPKLDGIETCRILRERPELYNTIIIFLTARNEDYVEIAGFEAGGDDFITKPIRIKTLMVRVASLLKRIKKEDDKEIKMDDFCINTSKRLIIIKGRKIKLPKLQFNLLKLLASNPERVFTRNEIYRKIWGDDTIVGERTLDVHIRNIRKLIGKDYIYTVKGIGYSFKNPDQK